VAKNDRSKKSASNALEKLFLHALADIYTAEKTASRALNALAGAATLPSLQAALTAHRDETETQKERIKKIFEIFDAKPRSIACKAINGIVDEGDAILGEFGDTDAADAAVIFIAQAIEHYEINRFGSLREWARELGKPDAARLLSEMLDAEYAADAMLSKIAEDQANAVAEGAQSNI
jgi:ferritin-like metal-binding protein YciE